MGSFRGLAARGVPKQAKFVTILQFIALFLSLVILGVCGYNVSIAPRAAGAGAFMIFIVSVLGSMDCFGPKENRQVSRESEEMRTRILRKRVRC
jgi:hypothetical protein